LQKTKGADKTTKNLPTTRQCVTQKIRRRLFRGSTNGTHI